MDGSEPGVQPPNSPQVFISHSHKDELYATKILAWLGKVGFQPWASFERCSDLYRVQIDKALMNCHVFLLIASKDSFESPEVRREIFVAGELHKPISYYKLDESSHKRDGFLSLLAGKQYVQASRKNLMLDKLAINLYEAFDGNCDDSIRQSRNDLIANALKIENQNYLTWKEKLWSLRLDSNNNTRKLSSIDRDILRQEASRLGLIVSIDDENEAFSLNRSSFKSDLVSLIAKRRIDKPLLSQIEKKRLECYVPHNLAVTMLRNRLERIDYLSQLSISKSADRSDHWLIAEIKALQSKRNSTSSKDQTNSQLQYRLRNRGTEGTSTFLFKQEIRPLEQYVNGICTTKMHVFSITSNGCLLAFDGIRGLKPRTLRTSTSVANILVSSDSVQLTFKGVDSRIRVSIDAGSVDYDTFILFLQNAVGVDPQPDKSKPFPAEDLPLNARTQTSTQASNKGPAAESEAPSSSTEPDDAYNEQEFALPDGYFYGIILFVGLMIGSVIGLQKLLGQIFTALHR